MTETELARDSMGMSGCAICGKPAEWCDRHAERTQLEAVYQQLQATRERNKQLREALLPCLNAFKSLTIWRVALTEEEFQAVCHAALELSDD